MQKNIKKAKTMLKIVSVQNKQIGTIAAGVCYYIDDTTLYLTDECGNEFAGFVWVDRLERVK